MHKSYMSERHWKKYGPGATGVGWDLWFLALGLQSLQRRWQPKLPIFMLAPDARI